MSFDSPEPQLIRRSAEELVAGLNPQQAQAVQYNGPALLIGAGAGSGKTRVLTRRIAWALSQWNAWPSQIIAITFTNKAAREMKDRLETLIGPEAQRMWVSTFHSACVRILRRNGKSVGLSSGFTIYDQADSQRLMRNIEQEFGIDPKRIKPRDVLSFVSDSKNDLKDWRSQLAENAPDFNPAVPGQKLGHLSQGEQLYSCLYAVYQQRLAAANSVDFDDLIMRTVQLLQIDPEAAAYYHHKFHYIFVDEYQDTNHAQYVLIRELSGLESSDVERPAWITVVGDSDQSIYAFRGADIHNILDFEKDFPQAKTIMLEQNYRSTQNILDAANAVISKNEGRRPKKLWTQAGEGDKIVGYAADNDQQEAQWVAREIARLSSEEGVNYSDIAIMYRANAQSRRFEEAMMNAGVPYQLIGGTRFYERKEVKDALAYLQCIANPADDVNMRRILNVPKRGLGERAEATVNGYASANGLTFWDALSHVSDMPGMTTRLANSLNAFRGLMTELMAVAEQKDSNPSEIVAAVLDKSGLVEELRKASDEKEQGRVENLSQFQSVAAEYEQNTPNASLAGFLENVALVADSDQLPDEGENRGTVTLMTLHTSKGLEYPVVFLVGLEEGTFPHSRALDNASEMSEERRLAYVGITRAKRRLYVTRAAVRSQWGRPEEMMPSEFLDDIPDDLIDWKRRETSQDMRLDSFGDAAYDGYDDGYSTYGGSSYGSRGSSYGSHGGSSYGSSYGSRGGSSYGSRGRSSYGGSSYGNRGSKVTTRRVGASHGSSAASTSSAAAKNNYSASDFTAGDLVTHDKYGLGHVISVEDKGANSTVTIDFGSDGIKHLVIHMAPIEKL